MKLAQTVSQTLVPFCALLNFGNVNFRRIQKVFWNFWKKNRIFCWFHFIFSVRFRLNLGFLTKKVRGKYAVQKKISIHFICSLIIKYIKWGWNVHVSCSMFNFCWLRLKTNYLLILILHARFPYVDSNKK